MWEKLSCTSRASRERRSSWERLLSLVALVALACSWGAGSSRKAALLWSSLLVLGCSRCGRQPQKLYPAAFVQCAATSLNSLIAASCCSTRNQSAVCGMQQESFPTLYWRSRLRKHCASFSRPRLTGRRTCRVPSHHADCRLAFSSLLSQHCTLALPRRTMRPQTDALMRFLASAERAANMQSVFNGGLGLVRVAVARESMTPPR